jgi:LacI family transcriptional regulator
VATISEVAARAGVSTATVSRALNGMPTVDHDLVARVRTAAEELGYQPNGPVVLCNSDENAEKENRYIDIAIQERVAGVILSPSGTTTTVAKLAGRGTAYVAVDRPLPGQDSDVVLVDTRLAAKQATTHLVAQGYDRIGRPVVASPSSHRERPSPQDADPTGARRPGVYSESSQALTDSLCSPSRGGARLVSRAPAYG